MRRGAESTKGNPRKLDKIFFQRLNQYLKDAFGLPHSHKEKSLLWSLIKGILSQNTSDKNRDLAFSRLQRRVSNAEEIASIPVDKLASIIRPAGLSMVRAARIKKMIENITEEEIRELGKLEPDEAMERLISIDGIGVKTAAVFLLFNFGFPLFPVDTHIRRILVRMGIFARGTSTKIMQDVMSKYLPCDLHFPIHINLINLGRNFCKSGKPMCNICPIEILCERNI